MTNNLWLIMPSHDKQTPKTLVVTADHSPTSGPSSTFLGSSAAGSSATASADLPELQGKLRHTETRQMQQVFCSLLVTNVICGITNKEKALHLPSKSSEDSWTIFSHVAKEHLTAAGKRYITSDVSFILLY